jgi:hypothetical protein
MVTDLLGLEEGPAVQGPDGKDTAFTWEILIVDDGSKDGTARLAQDWTRKLGAERVRLLSLYRNSGKGAAVRKGMMRARGQYILMADADGATRFSDIRVLLAETQAAERADPLRKNRAFAIGSRAHLHDAAAGSGATAKRTPLRRFLMWGFHTFVSFMVGSGGSAADMPEKYSHAIKDTQCGFKMFTRAAAREIFPVMHIERWAFDVELVFLAASKNMPMIEVPVQWQEMAGSKVDVASATIQMARDIIVIRLCYMTGIWSDRVPVQVPVELPANVIPKGQRAGAKDHGRRIARAPKGHHLQEADPARADGLFDPHSQERVAENPDHFAAGGHAEHEAHEEAHDGQGVQQQPAAGAGGLAEHHEPQGEQLQRLQREREQQEATHGEQLDSLLEAEAAAEAERPPQQ